MRRGTIRDDAVRFIKNRETFECGSMSGDACDLRMAPFPRLSLRETWMPALWQERFVLDNPVYVVWSFYTPIAWVAEDGREVIPPVKYSVRTTLHQSKCYQAMRDAAPWHKLREPAPYEVAA